MTTRILIAGAGAVGQVFGHRLAAGGADVAVLVRPRHEAEARRGFRLHRVPLLGPRRPETFRPTAVLTSPDQARGLRFDQVWLCVPTTALDPGWVAAVAGATGAATIVSLQPGLGVRDRLLDAMPEERFVQGVIAFLAWATPLEGSEDPRERRAEADPGTAYLVPPAQRVALSGVRERPVLAAVTALRDGGLPSDRVDDAEAELAVSSAMLMPFVAALEIAGWSLARFRSEAADLACACSREALAVASAETGRDTRALSALVREPFVRAGGLFGPVFAPFDLETYLRVHFTKVGAQTRLLLRGYGERARKRGLPHHALDRIERALEALA